MTAGSRRDGKASIPPQPVEYAAKRLNIALDECWQMVSNGQLEWVTTSDGATGISWPSLSGRIAEFYQRQVQLVITDYARKYDELSDEWRRRRAVEGIIVSTRWFLDQKHALEHEKEVSLDELARQFGVMRRR